MFEVNEPTPAAVPQNAPKCPAGEKSSQLDEVSLNEKKRAAVELLAMGWPYTRIAKELAIDRKTLFRWRAIEVFNDEVHRRQRELWREPGERLCMLVGPSIEVMAEHLADNYDRSRFRAASMVLRLLQKQLTREE